MNIRATRRRRDERRRRQERHEAKSRGASGWGRVQSMFSLGGSQTLGVCDGPPTKQIHLHTTQVQIVVDVDYYFWWTRSPVIPTPNFQLKHTMLNQPKQTKPTTVRRNIKRVACGRKRATKRTLLLDASSSLTDFAWICLQYYR